MFMYLHLNKEAILCICIPNHWLQFNKQLIEFIKCPNMIYDLPVIPVIWTYSFLHLCFQRCYEISGSDPQLVSTVIAPMKSPTMSFKLDLQGLGMTAANCIKLSYFTSFYIKAKCKCCSCTWYSAQKSIKPSQFTSAY